MESLIHFLKKLYSKIGFHTAAPHTLLYRIHLFFYSLYQPLHVWRYKKQSYLQRIAKIPSSHIAFHLNGGIGDHLIAARYIRDVMKTTPHATFDIYSRQPSSLIHWIFTPFNQFRNAFSKAPMIKTEHREDAGTHILSLNIINSISINYQTSALKRFPLLSVITDSIKRTQNSFAFFTKHEPYLDHLIGKRATLSGYSRHTLAHMMSKIPYEGNILEGLTGPPDLLQKFGLLNTSFITIHNGYDTAKPIKAHQLVTKVYPKFNQVVAFLKKNKPDLKIIQLGARTSQPIEEIDLNLINKTDYRDLATILAYSTLHIDVESGLVHLAKCVGTQCLAVFGSTSADYYGYPDNINITPSVCGGCFWVDSEWMTKCIRNEAQGIKNSKSIPCMESHDPYKIAKTILKTIETIQNPQKNHPLTLV